MRRSAIGHASKRSTCRMGKESFHAAASASARMPRDRQPRGWLRIAGCLDERAAQ